MASMVSNVSNVELSAGKKIVRKLTEKEQADGLILTRHKRKFEDTLIHIRLFPFMKDPKFHNGSWDILMTWLSEECDNKWSYYYGNHYEDFVFKNDDDDYYIQTKDRTNIYRIKTQSQMDEMCDEYIRDNICCFLPEALFYNLRKDAVKRELMPKNIKPDNAIIYDSVGCPVCLCDFVESENESDFIYKKATKQLEIGDDRVVRIETCCGHLLCMDCFNHIRNRGNQKCPTCRIGLDCWDGDDCDDEYEEEPYTLKDIEDLCYNEDSVLVSNNKLLEIVNLEELKEYIIGCDGYEGLVGAERIWEVVSGGGEEIFICLE